MKRHPILLILLTAIWFVETNHCAFRACLSNFGAKSFTVYETMLPLSAPQHGEGEESDHDACEAPCSGKVLGFSNRTFSKVVALPDLGFVHNCSLLLDTIAIIRTSVVLTSAANRLYSYCREQVSILRDAPNAPPTLQA